MIKLDDNTRLVKPTRGHEWLQGVPLHKEHRISKLLVLIKGREIIMNLVVQIPFTAIDIPWNRAAVEEWSSDDGGWGQVQRRGSNRALMGWRL